VFPYARLTVWRKAHELAVAMLTRREFDESSAGRVIGGQIRRASLSIAANIAEGAGSGSQPLFARYLAIALASSHETEYLLLAAHDARILPTDAYQRHTQVASEIKRMLTRLLQRVRKKTER
jgi:four helix bundle protein